MKKLKTLKYRLAVILFLNLLFSLNVLAVKFYSINSLYGISMRETNSVVEDDNGFVWAQAKIEGNKVIVWNKEISDPVSVLNAWADSPDGANL